MTSRWRWIGVLPLNDSEIIETAKSGPVSFPSHTPQTLDTLDTPNRNRRSRRDQPRQSSGIEQDDDVDGRERAFNMKMGQRNQGGMDVRVSPPPPPIARIAE